LAFGKALDDIRTALASPSANSLGAPAWSVTDRVRRRGRHRARHRPAPPPRRGARRRRAPHCRTRPRLRLVRNPRSL